MRAWAPGHITGFFSAVRRDDPLETGSLGAGICIRDGVSVEVESTSTSTVVLDGEETHIRPVERVLDMLDVAAHVEVMSEVPIGCGFGASGAATLAVALAADEEFQLDLDRDQLIAAAHVAEVKCGTGLGDVVPQSLGGVVTRVEAGAPGLGTFGSIDETASIEYTSFGGLDTTEVLGDEDIMGNVNRAGEEALDSLLENPGLEELVRLSWRFARDTGLPTERVENEVERINQEGGLASMAMLGETVFAVGGDNGLENQTEIAEEGARVID